MEKFAGKGGKFQVTLIAMGGPELASALARLDGHKVLVISADADPYLAERPAATRPDQEPLEFEPAKADEDGELVDGNGEEELDDVEAADNLPPHDPETGELVAESV